MYFGKTAYSAFYNSFDGGFTLSNAIWAQHDDVRYITVYPINGHVFVGTDGGVSKSTQNGNDGAWLNLNGSGLNVTEFYGLSGVEEQPNLIFAGAQDNYTWKFDNGTPSFVINFNDG